MTDHPRSRGVYRADRLPPCGRRGSSPLARGLPRRRHHRRRVRRIIPARAGFTEVFVCHETTGEDHPRSRGVYTRTAGTGTRFPGSSPLARVYAPSAVLIAPRRGSSPLARGLQGVALGQQGGPGIIPARAGFTR